MESSHRPETDARLLERYRIDDRHERARLLADLLTGSDMVTLYAGADPDCFVVSHVVAIDVDRESIDFEFNTDDARRAVFARSGRAVGTALLARVKLQFELDRVVLGPLPSAAQGSVDGMLRLNASLPVRLSRLQRREAYRVTPPSESNARLWMRSRLQPHDERRVPVMDVSATGLALRLQREDEANPVIGTVFGRCRLELPATGPIFCDLVVRSVAPGLPGERGSLRIGCEFVGLDPAAARAVQVFVNSAQMRGRRLRPGSN